MDTLNLPFLTWCAIVGVMMLLIICRVVKHLNQTQRQAGHALLQSGSEREEFFIPGDPMACDDDLCDDED